MPRYHVVLVTLIVVLLTACSGNNSIPAPAAPVFTSTPGTEAAEGSSYSYQLAASGTAVAFSLSNGPTGATLNGSTLSWTPTTQQSRVPNIFTVTATASGGGSAIQSWTVTPSGTIRISWIDTLWNETGGSTNRVFDWTPVTSYVAALVPQSDGTFKSLSGSVGPNGEFDIPNVPAGYFWLRIAPRGTYWTSSSTFDMGSDLFSPIANYTTPTGSTTSISFSFESLNPTPASGVLNFDTPDVPFPHYTASINAGSTTSFGLAAIGSNLDFSVIKNGFVRQYEAASFGSVLGYVLGPELTLSNLTLTTGGANTISGALNPAIPVSINLSVKGSAWTPLFDHIAPTAPTATGGGFYLSVQPYIAVGGPNISASVPIDLLWTKESSQGGSFLVRTGICSANPPLTTDVDAGTVQYSDPFPTAWLRTFRVCQSASITVPVAGTSQPQTIDLSNNQMTVLPTATVKPLLSGVMNPKINGTDFFTASTVNSTAVTLSWDPPAIGTPFGYNVAIMTPTAFPNGILNYSSATTLSTAKTSMIIPPNVLGPGRTYLFVITSLTDGRANMETSPHRSSLPVANADVISAPMTTN